MPTDTMMALAGLLMVMTWTPGPNNAMLAASGANYGLRRTIPHILGVALGFPLMLFCVAMGLGEVYARAPILAELLRWAGAALLIWVAWKIYKTSAPGSDNAKARPFTFLQAAGFQWINPKAWAMTVGLVAQFVTGQNRLTEAMICGGISVMVGLASSLSWASVGVVVQRILATPQRLHLFNTVMAVMILCCISFLFLDRV